MLLPLDQGILKAQSAGYRDDLDIVVHPKIGSTNDWSLQQCKAGRRLPFACFAEQQTSGKGRRGKHWVTAAGTNIALSLSWPFRLSRLPMQLLPFSIAIAVARTLSAYRLEQVSIKWPNDVFIRDRKIAGILIETQSLSSQTSRADEPVSVVVGVGLNFSMPDEYMREITTGITDISRELKLLGVPVDVERQEIASLLLQNLVSACEQFQLDSSTVLDDFRDHYDYCENKTVEILLDNQETLTGVAMGVNDAAELLVMVDGKVRTFNSAEVSVKTE